MAITFDPEMLESWLKAQKLLNTIDKFSIETARLGNKNKKENSYAKEQAQCQQETHKVNAM